MGLETTLRRFGRWKWVGGDGIIVDGSLLHGLAAPRSATGRDDAWARLSGSHSHAGTAGGSRIGRGRTILAVGTSASRAIGHVGPGSELRNRGTREAVGVVGEGVHKDAGVVVRVATRELDEFIGAGRPGLVTADVDLDAGGIELGTSGLIGQMKGDDFVTEKISTAGEVGRELERVGLSIELILLNPSTGTGAFTDFINLEPLSVRGVELVARSGTARSQVDFHRTSVVWPVLTVVGCPEHVNSAPRVGRGLALVI